MPDTTPTAMERLGTIVPLGNDASLAQINDTLNAHRAAILEVGSDTQRVAERASRMIPDMEKALAKARDARVEWVPGGSILDTLARYRNADGSFRLGRTTREVIAPDGNKLSDVQEGLLTDPYPPSREQAELRTRYAAFALAFQFSKRNAADKPSFADPVLSKAYRAFRRAAEAMPGDLGTFFREAFSRAPVGNSAGVGAELINVPTIADVRRPFDLARRVPGLIRTQMAGTSSFKPPIVTGRALPYRRGKTGSSPEVYPTSTFTSSDTTVTLVERVLNVLIDDSWTSEGGMVLDDPMGFIYQWIESGDADGLEMAFLHGDTAGTHQDTLSTWTMGGLYSAGALDGTLSPLKFWIGWRPRAFDDSATVAGGGAFGAADHFGALSAMGNHGDSAVAIMGLITLYTQILGSSDFTTYDKLGAAATLLTGEVGRIGKTPVIISEFLKAEYASTGLYTGSGSTGTIVYVNPDAYVHYDAATDDSWDVQYPERGARYAGVKRKSLLAPTVVSGEKPCAAIINV